MNGGCKAISRVLIIQGEGEVAHLTPIFRASSKPPIVLSSYKWPSSAHLHPKRLHLTVFQDLEDPIELPHRDPFTCSPNGEQVFASVFYNSGLRRARAEPLPKGCERFLQSSTMHTLQKGKKP